MIALTGHLGAGKTTLLNHLLRQPGGRVGVVVNDFGTINVDAGLVTGQIDEPLSIAGGCVCCLEDTDGLDEALERLTHPRLALDAVVVEASGVAEPGTLARMIRFSGAERVRPGGLVDVVDAVEFFATVDGPELPPARFGVATLVVLNKCDRLPTDGRESTLSRIESRIRETNPEVPIVRTSRGRLDPALVYDVASAEDPADELPIAELLREPYHRDHQHHHAASVSARTPGPVDPGRLVDLLERPPPGAYRIKGTVIIDTGRTLRGYLVNVVGRQTHVLGDRTTDPPASELVAIGIDLSPDDVRPRLETALRSPAGRNPEGFRRLQRLRRLSE